MKISAAPQAFPGPCNSDSKTLSPWLLRSGLLLVGVPTSHCCASCVSFYIVAGWQVWQAHTPPENALCQVLTLLQQLCLHPSLLPPRVHTAWVPWTWGLCLEASTPLAHVEPWWGGGWKRKTSKAHVSEMLANDFWPGGNGWVCWSLGYKETFGKSVWQVDAKQLAALRQRPLKWSLLSTR